MEKRWTLVQDDPETTDRLQQELKINRQLCKILSQRGIDTFDRSKAFFRPDLSQLHDPYLMKDMDKAVERVLAALDAEEPILVFGDYDVDGTTSVASMYNFLKKISEQVDFYIPHRYREGYGVSKAGIDHAHAHGQTLIIALDCGIKSVDLVAYAASLGIDFVICDHHLPDAVLPDAVAILNAKQPGCDYPYKELCGCGVGFKLIQALAAELGLPDEDVFQDLDLLATAIAADIVPLTGENRVLAWHGLRKANEHPNPGIRALAELGGHKSTMRIENLLFIIAPRINAAGRMDDAKKAVQLFISEDYEQALEFAQQLHSDNSDRKEADRDTTVEALELIRANEAWLNRKSTVLFQEHWHKGVVGIVASRVIERYYRPTIILTKSGDYVAGSARSVPGFNLYEAIHACRDHLMGYGGHFAAAGMTLQASEVDAFREKFEEVVSATIDERCLVPELLIDAELQFPEIRMPLYQILSQMEPFGPDNMRPVFISRGVRDNGQSKAVKESHLRICVEQQGITLTGIGFNMADRLPLLLGGQTVDIVYRLEENEWNNQKSLQLRLLDLRRSES